MTIEINQIIRRLDQGATLPYICGCSDGAKYVVKGSNTTRKHLAVELLCAFLCKEFGLPIPDFAPVRIPQEIIESGAFPDLDIEWCFGSKLVENLTEMVFSQVGDIDKQTMLDLYIFDYWVKNSDRCLTKFGGNPNAFYDLNQSSIVIFDHNLAFDDNFSIANHKDLHLASTVWNCEQKRMDDQLIYSDRFDAVMVHWQQFADEIPLDWFDNEAAKSSFLDTIRVRLLSYKDIQFWEGIK
ncbi:MULTISPECIES: HipA family kinase [unclassified Shewanella]|uniref:HipA family kinase n=1 Tax=Shewanella TaxID=22 RepID=UPI0021DB5A6F|nr:MULTISPECIES: HipA family kinase [unclassified Shewanella]MCU8044393.1 hypothetical protein [Shewanella sp. SM68]MCU8048475.1 hypothetical protein [Shewanella sp. SM65]